MSNLNIKSTTVSIITNKKKPITNLSDESTCKIYLKPICLSLENFKNSFYTYNSFSPNKFVCITRFNQYCISNHFYQDMSGNCFDGSSNFFDGSGNCFDGSGNLFDGSSNFLDGSSNFLDGSNNCFDSSGNCIDGSSNCFDSSSNLLDGSGNCIGGTIFSLYDVTLSKFMEYNGILCVNTIDPRYLIKYTNEVFKYTSFNDVPKVEMSIAWGNILHWIQLNKRSGCMINLNIEFHYYDENFMPGPVKYVFQYYIC